MVRFIFLLFVSLISLHASALEVSIETGVFMTKGKSYLEAYVRVLGNSAQFNNLTTNPNLKQASVELTFIVLQGEKIISFEKYVLNSPELKDVKDFLDVKRFALGPGNYLLKVEARDLYGTNEVLELSKLVSVSTFESPVSLSDIQLFGKVEQSNVNNPLAKNGIYMEPLTYGVVTEDIKVLNIYSEVYQQKPESENYFVKYAILEGFKTEGAAEVMKKVKRLSQKNEEPLLLQLPVDKLPSGNYRVEIEIFDKSKNSIITRSMDFVRENLAFDREFWLNYNKKEDNSFVSEMTADQLEYSLKATYPIINEPKKGMLNLIIKEAPIEAQRKFLFSVWKEKEPKNTEHHYTQYMTFAKAIDLEYNSNVGYGFETDRGYIFLRYGKPSNVLPIDQETDAYPYEIWYYNHMTETNQTNVRFIFYNKSLVHNDYSLLHSTCRGERVNPAWEIELYGKGLDTPAINTVDARQAGEGWDRQARKYFNEF